MARVWFDWQLTGDVDVATYFRSCIGTLENQFNRYEMFTLDDEETVEILPMGYVFGALNVAATGDSIITSVSSIPTMASLHADGTISIVIANEDATSHDWQLDFGSHNVDTLMTVETFGPTLELHDYDIGDSIAISAISVQLVTLYPAPSCDADFDENGSDDVADVLTLINNWGPCANCVQDLNADGIVDVADLLVLISAWGPCSP
jgi:hypothetical protein